MSNAQAPPVGQWSTGLCDCCDDCSSCFTTFCCPAITFGRNAEMIDEGKITCGPAARNFFFFHTLSLGMCTYLYSCTYRTKLRGKDSFQLPAEPCNDCCVHAFCGPCALCQEHRELKTRLSDPAKGWSAHIEKQRGNTTAPPAARGMDR